MSTAPSEPHHALPETTPLLLRIPTPSFNESARRCAICLLAFVLLLYSCILIPFWFTLTLVQQHELQMHQPVTPAIRFDPAY